MSVALNIAKAMNVVCDAFLVTESIADKWYDDNPRTSSASLASRAVNLTLSGAEIAGVLMETNAQSLERLKSFELFARFVGTPIKFRDEAAQYDGTLKGKLRLIERGVVAPLADMVRVHAEAQMYGEKKYLDLPPEEQATAQRPIYEWKQDDSDPESGHWEIVGHRPFDLKESEEIYAYYRKCHIAASSARVSSEASVLSSSIQNAYDRLARSIVSTPSQSATVDYDTFNLKQFNAIPDILFNDVVLSRYTCAITQIPIRDPVGDPNGTTLYERQAILDWLNRNPTSPMTRQPLSKDQLVEKPALKSLIDHRLEKHSKKLWDYVQQSQLFSTRSNQPASTTLQGPADAENPNY